MSPRMLLLLLFAGLGYTGVSVHAWGTVAPVPSESECRPYIEKALKELSTEPTQEAVDTASSPDTPQTTDTSDEGSEQEGSIEGTEESVTTDSAEKESDKSREEDDGESNESKERKEQEESGETGEQDEKKDSKQGESEEAEEQHDEQSEEAESNVDDSVEGEQVESIENVEGGEESTESQEAVEGEGKDESAEKEEPGEGSDEEDSTEGKKSDEDQQNDESVELADKESTEEGIKSGEESTEDDDKKESGEEASQEEQKESAEADYSTDKDESTTKDSQEESEETEIKSEEESVEKHDESTETEAASIEESEGAEEKAADQSEEDNASAEISAEDENKSKDQSVEEAASAKESSEIEDKSGEKSAGESEEDEEKGAEADEKESVESGETPKETESVEEEKRDKSGEEKDSKEEPEKSAEDSGEKSTEDTASEAEQSDEDRTPEEDLTIDVVIPEKLRPREHIGQILKLDSASAETELLLSKTMDITLRELKRLYDTAIQPLEILYKYRDLSNRHFGDPEIFSKPLILFMGPWSGGKSTIINYLLNNEYAKSALRTGAEPSPAYFNILMWGEREEVLDGTQLAADWTFSGLQKFGQGLLDRLRGLKLKNPLLEKVNIVEIPGILEIRKQVERLFPFNDACQWFIDRADIIFLVYDPSKLDVGPETEAILDQLKGREYQTRIILNKADQVKPEELMRVQGTLIWNISPLMSSSEPPVMYSTSLWSIPYEIGSPTRLLYAQEKAFLKDLRDAIDKRVENKIASARRFAVRVRNHAKMVDCYLTTYYNHKSFFGNRKKVADDIIEHPQNYHIYEGLSTLTNISRYDLPDPEVYRDFFRLNPVYDFQQLSATCTYFRGCPINRLDVAIAYDLPELVGKYKKSAESVLTSAEVPPKS